MKKLVLPLVLVIGVGTFAVWYFFLNNNNANGQENGTEWVDGMSRDSGDVPFGDPPSAEEEEREKRLREHARPGEFIILTFGSRKNLVGETVVEGSMTNNAQLTTYRDLQLIVYFDDGSGSPVDSAQQTVFEELVPGGKVEFRLKEKAPRKAKEVRVRIKDAVAVETK